MTMTHYRFKWPSLLMHICLNWSRWVMGPHACTDGRLATHLCANILLNQECIVNWIIRSKLQLCQNGNIWHAERCSSMFSNLLCISCQRDLAIVCIISSPYWQEMLTLFQFHIYQQSVFLNIFVALKSLTVHKYVELECRTAVLKEYVWMKSLKPNHSSLNAILGAVHDC